MSEGYRLTSFFRSERIPPHSLRLCLRGSTANNSLLSCSTILLSVWYGHTHTIHHLTLRIVSHTIHHLTLRIVSHTIHHLTLRIVSHTISPSYSPHSVHHLTLCMVSHTIYLCRVYTHTKMSTLLSTISYSLICKQLYYRHAPLQIRTASLVTFAAVCPY